MEAGGGEDGGSRKIAGMVITVNGFVQVENSVFRLSVTEVHDGSKADTCMSF